MIKYEFDKMSLIKDADNLLKQLFPICRSITGEGLRKTLSELNKVTDFEILEIPSGEKHYDWDVPEEWNINDAYIKDSKGKKIIDFKNSNLHVMNYSISINSKLSYHELKSHLYTLPNLPNAIPYKTSYYNKGWGFCLSHEQLENLNKNETYDVYIDSSFSKGSMTLGEKTLGNKVGGKNYLLTTYPCHPSLGNDNLSGVVLWTLLLKEMNDLQLRNNYRFVIHPETIGAVAYLSMNESEMIDIDGGFIISSVAGPGKIGFKKTYKENSIIDYATELTLKEKDINYIEYFFDADAGSDERQYSSQFFSIPMATICKDKYFEYDFYHTSLDNLEFISGEFLVETLEIYMDVINKLENNFYYKSLNTKCEPMLGKRDLYPKTGGQLKQSVGKLDNDYLSWDDKLKAINWLMYLCDGNNSILDIAKKTKISFSLLIKTAGLLEEHHLLQKV
jgi:aminopeptidase-like protein